MPIDPSIAVGAELPDATFSWSASDVALYNLAVGAAADPMDTAGLGYIDDVAPKVLPSFATVAANFHATEAPKVSYPGIDIDLAKVVHGSQEVIAHRAIPASGSATTRSRIVEVQDKGSAAVVISEKVTSNADGPLWTERSSIFAKGEGGFSGERGESVRVTYPDRAADHRIAVPTAPNQALLYRLCGDRNPLHSAPEFAKAAGFPRPILHGLCSYGLVCRSLVDELFDGDVEAIGGYSASFAGIVFPGETLVVDVWEDGQTRLLVKAAVAQRDGAAALGNVVVTRS
ncbi:MaoC/PaaZ C-terminal domain-containing protein [Gordonia sp. CPCC 205333]|uniref:MaoC/PaaZ C-terminal domain-containing protein n=1 Tax=Gordonia sp. CPCC 205333 TaxID=3140790 RepID=UPI003AF3BAA9